VPHWSTTSDGGPGHCFPDGHASSGFAFLGGFFAFRRETPRLARCWLAAAMAAGLVLGIGQQLRGAHFMSHTLWSGWLCWVVALLATLVIAGLLLAIGVWRIRVRHVPWKAQALRNLVMLAASLALAVGLILLCFQPLSSTMRNHKQLRYLINPLNTLYSLGYA